MCTAHIHGVMVKHTIIDGGSSTNILNVEMLPLLGLSIRDLSVCPLFFKGASQERLPVVGIFDNACVTVQGVTVTIAFTVVRMVADGYPALLGQPWLEIVQGQHDWTRRELVIGPPNDRRVLKLARVFDEKPTEVWYDGRLKMEPLEKPVDVTEEEEPVSDDEREDEPGEGEEEYLSLSSEEEEVALVDCYRVSLVDILEAAHERLIRPAVMAQDWACRRISADFGELPALHLEEEDPREAVVDLEFMVQEGESRTVKVGKQLEASKVIKYASLFTEFGHLFIEGKQILPQTVLNEHKIELKAGA